MRRPLLLPSTILLLSLYGPAPAAEPAGAGKRPMTVEDLWNIKRVGPPSTAPDGKWAVVEVTTFDAANDDSSSNLWLLATDGSAQKQLTNTKTKNSSPCWSPDGQWIAFLSKRAGDETNQIHVIAPAGGEARRVSSMPMAPSGIKWSADSKTVYCIGWTWPDTPNDDGYKQKDKALRESKAKGIVIDGAVYRYWDRWIADGKQPVVFAVDVASGNHRNLLAGTGKSLPPYEPGAKDYDVSPDGEELCFVADSVKDVGRDVNYDLFTLALGAGVKAVLKNITTDNPANDTSPIYSPDGKHLAFLRQTIKYFYADRQRLMLMDRATGQKRELTASLDRSCANPKWMPDNKRLVFEAEDKGVENIYFVGLDGSAPRTFPTGFSERSFDPARTIRVGVYLSSSFDRPPTVFSHRPGEKEPRQIEHFNDDIVKRWKLGKVEERTFKGADGDDVQMWILYPPDFDPSRKWPLVQVVHGGPHNGIMTDFSFRWNLQLWAAQGYVIGCVNFHGSSGFGQKFCDSITGDYGTKPLEDVMIATDWFAAQPWIDKDRMAAAGGSYGGYMMAWLNGHTDRFKAMVCHAGVYSYHSQMASDIVRGRERALGAFPWGDLAKIDKQSAQRFAANFKTPTLVLHGEKDYRVPVTQGLEYYNTLRQKGVPARLVYFPDENHWILKPQNSLLWHKEVFGWLAKHIGGGSTKAVQGQVQPNVVMIVGDDQGWSDFGFMGHKVVKTPRLDQLAAESAVFPNSYVPTSLCRASLATLLTGQFGHQHKICCNDPPDGMARDAMHPFMKKAPALPRLLSGAGYRSLQTGKFWEGHFTNAGFTDGMTTKGRHGDDGLAIGRQTMKPIYDFIEANRAKPFFLWYAPMLPHEPHNPPERFLKKYAVDGRNPKLAKYFAMCEWFDETCGELLDYLDKKGLRDNTLVVFVVDNGWIQETAATRTTRGNFAPKSKLSPYDGGVRVPVLLRWPGHTKPGRHDDLVSTIDLAPTIVSACGLKPPAEMPGLSLLEVAAGKGPLPRQAVFGEIYVHTAKDINNPAVNLTHRWVRAGDWKFILPLAPDGNGAPELYDLAHDPNEEKNLAAAQADKVRELRARLDAFAKGAF